MNADDQQDDPVCQKSRVFATTRWSLVLAAGDASKPAARHALSELCRSYWFPLYSYVRRRVDNVDDAQDLTQAFFSHLLEKQSIARADPTRGRFRSFLLTARNFLANEWDKARADKRGGATVTLSLDLDSGESRYQLEPATDLTPDSILSQTAI